MAQAPFQSRHAILAVPLRAAGAAMQLVLAYAVGQSAGAEGLGYLYLLISWSAFAAVVFGLGFPTLALQIGAAHRSQKDPANDYRFIARSAAYISCVGLVAVVFIWPGFAIGEAIGVVSRNVSLYVPYVLVTSTAIAVIKLVSDFLKGLGTPNSALIIEFALLPGIAAALTFAFSSFANSTSVRGHFVLAAYTAASVFTTVAAALVVIARAHWTVPSPAFRDSILSARFVGWRHFWAISILNQAFLFAPYLLMPFYFGKAEIGQFGLAFRFAAIGATINLALSAVFAPQFRQAFNHIDVAMMRRAYRMSVLLALLFYIPFLAAFAFWRNEVFHVFATDTDPTLLLFVVFALGRLIVSIVGPADTVVVMVGMERYEMWNAFLGFAVFASIASLAANHFGIVGLAAAFVAVQVGRVLFSFVAYRRWQKLRASILIS